MSSQKEIPKCAQDGLTLKLHAVSQSQIETEILLCSLDSPTEVLNIVFTLLKRIRRTVTGTKFKRQFGAKTS